LHKYRFYDFQLRHRQSWHFVYNYINYPGYPRVLMGTETTGLSDVH